MTTMTSTVSLSQQALLDYWLGHRVLTRRTIEAFPDEALFSFKPTSTLRSFGEMMLEVVGMIEPTLAYLRSGEWTPTMERFEDVRSKTALLAAWDEATRRLMDEWTSVPSERVWAVVPPLPHLVAVPYLIDNEVHHRAQGFVYLRLLEIEPPAFYER
ncbi:DinB family protein [Deinococcus yavapaiensis]|uniref:Putative damage-inducible protein DinB n=1 Tax=Deinococcus yavapaiensis KR-236 TaxID=694435 RepID=A0A318S9C6_9DEIO|nr:DinB family protein [Deinococcus yavapaiensis]PYE53631.1 putative damage-inducible protein DinB [Deinococcus yavapaiensis KR-236]